MAVAFRRAARTEFLEAARWYESQRRNLGHEFIAEIDRCIALATEQHQIYPAIFKDVRRITATRFPYSVYFRVEVRRIVVLAVFHGNRDPLHWQSRT